MLIQWSIFLLPVAAGAGWLAGHRALKKEGKTPPLRLRNDYFRGLNYLINEQPDKAVDVFVRLLEVDSDTVETHLALGSLFRRRGEVDRAIRIHQNLIARPQLEKNYRLQALAALGQDYLSAGVLDRAERLFQELVSSGDNSKQGLQCLLRIYEQEKDWAKAIQAAQKLGALTKQPMSSVIAQYYCELAEEALGKSWRSEALNNLKKAQAIHHDCVRASFMRGNMALTDGNHEEAIRCFNYIKKQNPAFLPEAIDSLSYCYYEKGDKAGWLNFLMKCLVDQPFIKIVIAIAEYKREYESSKSAIDFVSEQIQRRPSMRGLEYLLNIYLSQSYGETRDKLDILQRFIHRIISTKPIYCCEHCGFSSKTLLWQCPSCHHWETVQPIQGFEGG